MAITRADLQQHIVTLQKSHRRLTAEMKKARADWEVERLKLKNEVLTLKNLLNVERENVQGIRRLMEEARAPRKSEARKAEAEAFASAFAGRHVVVAGSSPVSAAIPVHLL